jgi:hypothetical protein
MVFKLKSINCNKVQLTAVSCKLWLVSHFAMDHDSALQPDSGMPVANSDTKAAEPELCTVHHVGASSLIFNTSRPTLPFPEMWQALLLAVLPTA